MKFCKCAEGSYGYQGYTRTTSGYYTSYYYGSSADNANYAAISSANDNKPYYLVQCNDGVWYNTNRDYYTGATATTSTQATTSTTSQAATTSSTTTSSGGTTTLAPGSTSTTVSPATTIPIPPLPPDLECTLEGDYAPCDDISLQEVVDAINLWVVDRMALGDIVKLITAWSAL
jgi:hypothetical protein